MKIEWKHLQCIVCLVSGKLTKEHVIPDSLGGILTSNFLCSDCNSSFGCGFEAKARLSPELRKAASQLSLPELKEKLERGALYKTQFGEHTSEQKLRNDGLMGTAKLGDKSLIVPEPDASERIKSMMQKKGVLDREIKEALAAWEAAPAASKVDLGSDISILKWQEHPATPTYTEPPLSPLVPLKIAYEFAALLVGSSIYRSEFQNIRDILLKQNEDLAGRMVTYKCARKPDAFHGIAFGGSDEIAQFQVRLFGFCAYTVRFPKIAIQHSPLVYTHQLDIGNDWLHMPNKDERKPDDLSDHQKNPSH